jgi:hypothetical protein
MRDIVIQLLSNTHRMVTVELGDESISTCLVHMCMNACFHFNAITHVKAIAIVDVQ